jgi:hypothetical protein
VGIVGKFGRYRDEVGPKASDVRQQLLECRQLGIAVPSPMASVEGDDERSAAQQIGEPNRSAQRAG